MLSSRLKFVVSVGGFGDDTSVSPEANASKTLLLGFRLRRERLYYTGNHHNAVGRVRETIEMDSGLELVGNKESRISYKLEYEFEMDTRMDLLGWAVSVATMSASI